MFNKEEIKKIKLYTTIILIAIIIYHLIGNLNVIKVATNYVYFVFTPIIYGFIIAFILNIPMKNIEFLLEKTKISKKYKRTISLTITFSILISLIAGLIHIIIPQLKDNIPTLIKNISDVDKLQNTLNYVLKDKLSLSDANIQEISNYIGNLGKDLTGYVTNGLGLLSNYIEKIAAALISFVLSLVIAIYMLINKETLLLSNKKFFYSFFNFKIVSKCNRFLDLLNESFTNFIKGQILEAFILSFICYIGMLIFKFPYAMLISVIIGFTNIIPLFGAYLGGFVSIIMLLIINPIYALYFCIYLVVIQQIESNLIYPKVVGGSIGLSGFWVLAGVIVGNNMFGVAGILLGIPILSTVSKLINMKTHIILNEKNLKFNNGDIWKDGELQNIDLKIEKDDKKLKVAENK